MKLPASAIPGGSKFKHKGNFPTNSKNPGLVVWTFWFCRGGPQKPKIFHQKTGKTQIMADKELWSTIFRSPFLVSLDQIFTARPKWQIIWHQYILRFDISMYNASSVQIVHLKTQKTSSWKRDTELVGRRASEKKKPRFRKLVVTAPEKWCLGDCFRFGTRLIFRVHVTFSAVLLVSFFFTAHEFSPQGDLCGFNLLKTCIGLHNPT